MEFKNVFNEFKNNVDNMPDFKKANEQLKAQPRSNFKSIEELRQILDEIEANRDMIDRCCGAIEIYLKTLQRENNQKTEEIEW